MFNIDEGLIDKIKDINEELHLKYSPSMKMEKNLLRKAIEEKVGKIEKLEKMDEAELKNIKDLGGIGIVDGSVNRIGGMYPHYIELFQGLALSSDKTIPSIYTSNIYTPLASIDLETILENDEDEIVNDDRRNKYLSEIELDAAIEYAEKNNPYCIMMDGSLIRFAIDSNELWLELRDICERKKILLIGVIEDIKTNVLAKNLKEEKIYGYDRELLFNILDMGEIIRVKDNISGKYKKAGLSSIFMRASKSPNTIGIDILDVQRKDIEQMARLVYTLTPESSRGIPFVLDIVDKEVKISNLKMESLIKSYIDVDIYEKLFHAQRTKR